VLHPPYMVMAIFSRNPDEHSKFAETILRRDGVKALD
jgi:hypothetical protein